MFKQRTLAAYLALILLPLLSSVTGDEGVSGDYLPYDSVPFLISTLKEMCLERLDPLSCKYWDKIAEFELSNAIKTKQPIDLSPENRTSGREIQDGSSREEISFEVPVIDIENNLHKRFSVFRRKNPTARGYKRGPGFRSWGGKRDLLMPGPGKRSKFASWGGKRDNEVFPDNLMDGEDAPDKRQKFQNWGGKKSTNDFAGYEGKRDVLDNEMEKREPIWKDRGYYLSEPFKKHVPKRPQFQSWGGKRATLPWHGYLQIFHPQPRFILRGGEKRKFSSWGGKRYDELENQYENDRLEEPWNENKRHVFQNWGGKRGASDNDALRESEPRETTKERSKREVKTDEETPHDYNSRGDQLKEGKNRR